MSGFFSVSSVRQHSRAFGPAIGIAADWAAFVISVYICDPVRVSENEYYHTAFWIGIALLAITTAALYFYGTWRNRESDRFLGHHPGESSLHWDWRWLVCGIALGLFSGIALWSKMYLIAFGVHHG